jgi:hypothetical protein
MNFNKIKELLSSHPKERVDVYVSYLKEALEAKNRDGEKINKWMAYMTDKQAVDLFNKVAIDNLYIDGETITLQNKGKIMVSYNYQAYKNKLLNIYPESKFDIQLVHAGDAFSFRKESGKVLYTHEMKDPFAKQKEIIGTYCIIKNDRGEFIETLNMTEITKMKNVAKTKKIWDAWEGEMCLKSVTKRACKRHFNDLVVNIEKIDNDNYELENVNLEFSYSKLIEDAETLEDLGIIFEENKDKVSDKEAFMNELGKRKEEIKLKIQQDADSNS